MHYFHFNPGEGTDPDSNLLTFPTQNLLICKCEKITDTLLKPLEGEMRVMVTQHNPQQTTQFLMRHSGLPRRA